MGRQTIRFDDDLLDAIEERIENDPALETKAQYIRTCVRKDLAQQDASKYDSY